MRVLREAKLSLGRVDYVYELSVGVEVKSVPEIVHHHERVIRQLKSYMRDLDYLILLVEDSSSSADVIKSLPISIDVSRQFSCRVAVAIGSKYDPLTWRAIVNDDVVSVVKRRAGEWCGND